MIWRTLGCGQHIQRLTIVDGVDLAWTRCRVAEGKSKKRLYRVALYIFSAAASAIIGLYVTRLFQKEKEFLVDVFCTEALSSDQARAKSYSIQLGEAPPSRKVPIPVFDQIIEVENIGDLPLMNLTIQTVRRDTRDPFAWRFKEFGDPSVTPIYRDICDVRESDRWTVTWFCELLNPNEWTVLHIKESVGSAPMEIAIRAEGFSAIYDCLP